LGVVFAELPTYYFIGWLLCNAKMSDLSTIWWRDQVYQLYDGETKLHVNEMMIMSTLYLTKTLSWIFIVRARTLKQQPVGRHIAPLGDILSWFRVNQFLLLVINDTCLAEKQHKYQVDGLWFDPTGARTHDLPHAWRAY
jgi:hypothetical protein